MDPALADRPGVTSRIRRAPGRSQIWRCSDKNSFRLPVIVDHVSVDPDTGDLMWRIEATVSLVDGSPALTRVDALVPGGLDPVLMQREFRWASPLEVVTLTVPILLARGVDPFTFDLPVTRFRSRPHWGRSGTRP